MEQLCLFEKTKSDDWKWNLKDLETVDKNGLKVFSCFACGGGSTMGYKLAGYDVIGCCEIDPRMNEIYRVNHNPKYNYLMDIRDFNNLEDLPMELYDLDILDGSPLCTTFSIAGDREKTWGVKKKFREGQKEQTLDDLSFIFIETVAKLRPKVVVMENVEGLLQGDAWGYVQEIYKRFKEIGYNVKHYLLKGENMGVPQKRHRVFFIANRIGKEYIDLSFDYDPVTYGKIKSGKGVAMNENSVMYKILSRAQYGDKRLADVLLREGGKEKFFNNKICWEDDVMFTITAKLEHYRGSEKCRISIEDIIHGQTFPEDYNFIKRTWQNVGYICGMSVPPVMIKRIAMEIYKQWLSTEC